MIVNLNFEISVSLHHNYGFFSQPIAEYVRFLCFSFKIFHTLLKNVTFFKNGCNQPKLGYPKIEITISFGLILQTEFAQKEKEKRMNEKKKEKSNNLYFLWLNCIEAVWSYLCYFFSINCSICPMAKKILISLFDHCDKNDK